MEPLAAAVPVLAAAMTKRLPPGHYEELRTLLTELRSSMGHAATALMVLSDNFKVLLLQKAVTASCAWHAPMAYAYLRCWH